MRTKLPLVACLTLILGMGVFHGRETDRWRTTSDLPDALARLSALPTVAGDWVGKDAEIDADQMAVGGIKGWSYRRFVNARTGSEVAVLIVCGKGGPISVHTPDICYAGAGYIQIGESRTVEVPFGTADVASLWKGAFAKPGAVVPSRLEIWWCWTRDGKTWEAPPNERVAFGRSPSLYKMYVIHEAGGQDAASNRPDVCQEFLRVTLPEFQRALDRGPARANH